MYLTNRDANNCYLHVSWSTWHWKAYLYRRWINPFDKRLDLELNSICLLSPSSPSLRKIKDADEKDDIQKIYFLYFCQHFHWLWRQFVCPLNNVQLNTFRGVHLISGHLMFKVRIEDSVRKGTQNDAEHGHELRQTEHSVICCIGRRS